MLKWKERQVVLKSWPNFEREDMIPEQMNASLEAEIMEQEVPCRHTCSFCAPSS